MFRKLEFDAIFCAYLKESPFKYYISILGGVGVWGHAYFAFLGGRGSRIWENLLCNTCTLPKPHLLLNIVNVTVCYFWIFQKCEKLCCKKKYACKFWYKDMYTVRPVLVLCAWEFSNCIIFNWLIWQFPDFKLCVGILFVLICWYVLLKFFLTVERCIFIESGDLYF